METYYYLYKITNLINNKIYIGVHRTKDLDDDYMGSGLLIKLAIEKYGIENFEKSILQHFNNVDEMFEAESIVVNENFVKLPNTYNIKEGGHGGWDHIPKDHYTHSKENAIFMTNRYVYLLENDPDFREHMIKVHSETLKLLHSEGKIKYDTFTGKRHSDESKAKIGAANSKHQSGSGNSQYGTMWIYNEDLKESKRISKDDQIPEGWNKGRKIKF